MVLDEVKAEDIKLPEEPNLSLVRLVEKVLKQKRRGRKKMKCC